MSAGDDETFDLPRQHRAIGRVIVAPARNRVGKPDALHHVVLGDDVFAFEQARLAHAGLRRDIDENGDLLVRRMGKVEVERRKLLPLLAEPSWLDPKTRGPK